MNETVNQTFSPSNNIIGKINKLLRLSEGTHSQAEAQSAMLKVQDMLEQYNLSMGDLSQEEKPAKEVVTENSDISRARMPGWWGRIAMVVASNFRCYVYYTSRYDSSVGKGQRVKRLTFIGMKQDVEACIATIRFAIEAAENCWTYYKKESDIGKRDVYGRNVGSGVKNDYLDGFVAGLQDSFASQVREKAIVVVKDALVERTYKSMGLRKGAASRTATAGDQQAYNKGKQDGASFRNQKSITK